MEIGLTTSFKGFDAAGLVLTESPTQPSGGVARIGFANPTPTSIAALALVVWVVALTLASRQGGQTGLVSPAARRSASSGT